MSEFDVTKEKLEEISTKFRVDPQTVRAVFRIFTDVISGVKNQYLAHIIRCMEVYIRSHTGNPMFQINCFPIDPESPVLNVGCAQYFNKRFFSVFFHPRMEAKQLRVCLAHELGHLFIVELLNDSGKEQPPRFDEKTQTEPVSSILGIFTIMDKNAFYKDQCRELNHHSWEDIIQDFILLQNKVIN
jgi:hypothetical protein